MRGDILPLPQYAFMAWCSGTTKPLPDITLPEIVMLRPTLTMHGACSTD